MRSVLAVAMPEEYDNPDVLLGIGEKKCKESLRNYLQSLSVNQLLLTQIYLPKNNAVNVPMDYSLAWNYPYKKDYSATTAIVSLSGPGVNRTESFDYPYNVLFQTFQPGGTYNWSVSVDGVSGGSWTFQVDDKIYPTNDRSIDTTASEVILPYQINNLIASDNRLAFLRFDIPSSVNSSYKIKVFTI